MIKFLLSKFNAWRQFRASIRELSSLSDRDLNDLGVARSDIYEIVRQGPIHQG